MEKNKKLDFHTFDFPVIFPEEFINHLSMIFVAIRAHVLLIVIGPPKSRGIEARAREFSYFPMFSYFLFFSKSRYFWKKTASGPIWGIWCLATFCDKLFFFEIKEKSKKNFHQKLVLTIHSCHHLIRNSDVLIVRVFEFRRRRDFFSYLLQKRSESFEKYRKIT